MKKSFIYLLVVILMVVGVVLYNVLLKDGMIIVQKVQETSSPVSTEKEIVDAKQETGKEVSIAKMPSVENIVHDIVVSQL